ncbi:DUF91 domain-containing protein [bacterium]|nr:DUF91 domain-containing protein [bacterium]
MADIKLFNINGKVRELQSGTVTLEKELQNIIEKNMKSFFGVSFLKSEFSTTDGGRMDSIGIDENNCPVIFEYKRSLNENVINQGLFYLNWLLDHKESFTLLVIDVLGLERSKSIDWTRPRVVCIANDFTKYDISAINQMTRNISLIRYKKFENDLLMFEHINDKVVDQIEDVSTSEKKSKNYQKTFTEKYNEASEKIKNLYDDLKNEILSYGDEVTENTLKFYTAFKKIQNFICAEIFKEEILLHLKLNPSTVTFEKDFTRDVTGIGHYGTGDVELHIRNTNDLDKARDLLLRAYQEN